MYTEIKPYQIIIQLLKERGIRHCVLSAGSRNVPFVHSIEEDPFSSVIPLLMNVARDILL